MDLSKNFMIHFREIMEEYKNALIFEPGCTLLSCRWIYMHIINFELIYESTCVCDLRHEAHFVGEYLLDIMPRWAAWRERRQTALISLKHDIALTFL